MIANIAYLLLAAVVFFVTISALIFFHELGHYGVGRLFGIKVDRFSIGFGKPIWKRTAKSGTEWAISRIPLGGYVKFAGDAGAASNPDAQMLEAMRADGKPVDDIFHFRPVWQRALVVLAGPMANFILAAIMFAVAFMWVGTRNVEAVIGSVQEGSPAAAAGIEVGDRILVMDGKAIDGWTDLVQHIALRAETPIDVVLERDGREVELTVTPVRKEDRDFVGGKMTKGFFGVGVDATNGITTTRYGPIEALGRGVAEVGNSLGATGHYIGRIFTGRESGEQLGSILRIGTMVGKSTTDVAKAEAPFGDKVKALLVRLLTLGAGISVALGFANLLPIPMLDGGHLVYYGYEAVAGKPLSMRMQEVGYRLGMALILILFVVLTVNDIGYLGSIFSKG